MGLFKKHCAALTAALMLTSVAINFAPQSVHAASVNMEADYAVSEGPLVRTEQFNNTNYTLCLSMSWMN